MKRILTTFKRGEGSSRSRSGTRGEPTDTLPSPDDSPETAIVKAVNAFCASGGPTSSDPGSEVLHLPTIVDSAESSPTAARAAATVLRKQLDLKNNNSKPYLQYNAIMLLRILADNPGPTFTRNLAEPKFINAIKCLLREGKDPSVQQILGETLDYFAISKSYDEGLKGLHDLWSKEKKNGRTPSATPPPIQHSPFAPVPRNRSPPGLPSMSELVARIAEAQTSASLLSQVLQSTPQAEVPVNELVKEFADRCKAASRSMVAYISADPPPDEDTLTTLIETNEVLGQALEHWRKVANSAQQAALESGVGRGESTIVDVVDVGNPAVLEGVEGREGREVMHGASTAGPQEDYRREVGDFERPPSPVSPVVPHHPVSYRY